MIALGQLLRAIWRWWRTHWHLHRYVAMVEAANRELNASVHMLTGALDASREENRLWRAYWHASAPEEMA